MATGSIDDGLEGGWVQGLKMGTMTSWGMCLYSWCCGKVDLGGGVPVNLSSQDEDDRDTLDRQPLVRIVKLLA